MSILVNRETRVLVQGITGRSGALQTESLLQYGTYVVAGVTPGKGGTSILGVPVYDDVASAVASHGRFDAAISFVPPASVKSAALEAIDAGIGFSVITVEGIARQDSLAMLAYARPRGALLLGPGTAGLIAPGKCKLGAHPSRMFAEGRVGIVSKSGALSYEVGKVLTENGIGQSTVVALGGGPIWGMTHVDVVRLFNEDPETDVIVLLGEIGGSTEVTAAEYIAAQVRKPVVALIVGRAAPAGKSLGHAGAIVEGRKGTADYKMEVLRNAGAHIVFSVPELVEKTASFL